MVPTPVNHASNRYPRLTYSLLSLATHGLSKLAGYSRQDATDYMHSFLKREPEAERENKTKFIVFAILIPVLVLLSGLFAGLTLGYMSLDETQLHVLSISGTPYVPSSHSMHSRSSNSGCPQQAEEIRGEDSAYPKEWPPAPHHASIGQHDRQRNPPSHFGTSVG